MSGQTGTQFFVLYGLINICLVCFDRNFNFHAFDRNFNFHALKEISFSMIQSILFLSKYLLISNFSFIFAP